MKCRVCGSTRSKQLFDSGKLVVLKCGSCASAFLETEDDDAGMYDLYKDYGTHEGEKYFSKIDEEVEGHIRSYLETARSLVPADPKLLDIGSGNGALLSAAKDLGFNCEGVEIAPGLAAAVRKRTGCTIHEKTLGELGLEPESFDVVTMYDLVEHLPTPAADLRLVLEVLKPGGILFMLTPNEDALTRRIAKLLNGVSGGRFAGVMNILYYRDHLSYFSKKGLFSLMKGAGFEVEHWETANQEISRLQLSPLQKLQTRMIFTVSDRVPILRGKHIVYGRKPASS
jgi:2-polyprenyl-3-methyl-5-hydroxy-6-metoxy-1,4-benzoquinol methylase